MKGQLGSNSTEREQLPLLALFIREALCADGMNKGASFEDIFGQRVAPWLANQLENAEGSRVLATPALLSQLGTPPGLFDKGVRPHKRLPVLLYPVPERGVRAAAVACALHARRTCRVHTHRGDTLPDFDLTAPCLSPRGVSLTKDPSAQVALAAVAARKGYSSPFWLSVADISALASFTKGALTSLGILSTVQEKGMLRHLYRESNEDASTVVNDRSELSRVVNLCELQGRQHKITARMNSISFFLFRKFRPINVRSCRPFDPSVEDRLRAESVCSGCWCSVWGTREDYELCGCTVLRGALGVQVFDAVGNSVFLINALCTEDPAAAYAAAFPSRTISLVQ